MFTDPIADFLTRIRNAQAARLELMTVPASRMKWSLAKILEQEGFVGAVRQTGEGTQKTIEITLKYLGKAPFIRSIRRISSPGRRVYRGAQELPRVLSDQGIAVLSTSVGLMTNKEARKRKLGGEILCEVY